MCGCRYLKGRLPFAVIVAALVALVSCSAPASSPASAPIPSATLGPILSLTPTEPTVIQPTLPPTITLPPTRTATPTATPILYAYVRAQRYVTVYSGPGEGFIALALLLPDEQVRLRGRDDAGEWYFVQLQDGRSGWVSSALLRTEAETEAVSTAPAASGTLPPLPATATPFDLPVVDAPPVMPTAGLPPSDPSETPPPPNQQRGVQVFALCDNPALGPPPPRDLAAGSIIVVWWAWLAETAAQIEDHLTHVDYEVTVDGSPLATWRAYQGEPMNQGSNWAVHWYVPFPLALTVGEHRIEYRASWRQRISDGLNFYGPGTSMQTEIGSCTFTVHEGA